MKVMSITRSVVNQVGETYLCVQTNKTITSNGFIHIKNPNNTGLGERIINPNTGSTIFKKPIPTNIFLGNCVFFQMPFVRYHL